LNEPESEKIHVEMNSDTSPLLGYIKEQDEFNASLGKPSPKGIHDWMNDPLKPAPEPEQPVSVCCAVCLHEWSQTIIDEIMAVSLKCPSCGSTAGMLMD